MAIDVRGTPGWTADRTAPPAPAGWQVGDTVILLSYIEVTDNWNPVVQWTNRPDTWRGLRQITYNSTNHRAYLNVAWMEAPSNFASLLVTPTMTTPHALISTIKQMVIAFSGAGGVDTSVYGTGRVSCMAGGAALFTGFETLTSIASLDSLASTPTVQFTHPPTGAGKTGWKGATAGGYVGDVAIAGEVLAVEILPALTPYAPTIITPASAAQVATGTDVVVEWAHIPGRTGGSQKAYRLRVRQDGGTWTWWDSTDLDATASVTVTSTAMKATLPTAMITATTTIDLIVETQEALDDQWSPVSSTREVPVVSPPTVIITAPTGTVTGDMTPTFTWTTTPDTGLAQIDYRMTIADPSAVMIYDSGTLTGAVASLTPPATTTWVNAGVHTATVTVAQTGGATAVDSQTFTMSWTPPADPAAVTATVAAFGVTVLVDAAVSQTVVIERIYAGTYTPLGTFYTDATHDKVTITDVFGPDASVTYRARVGADLDGITLWSSWVTSAARTRTDRRQTYIASAQSPATTWQSIGFREDNPRIYVRGVATYYPLGSPFARVLAGTSKGQSGSMTVYGTDLVDLEDLVDLLECGETLLLRYPGESHTAGTTIGHTLPVAIASPVGADRLAMIPYAKRIVPYGWVEQANVEPTGSLAPETHSPVLS